MSELDVVYIFFALLALFVVVGALIPRYLPRLVRYMDETVLKEEKSTEGKRHGSEGEKLES